MTWRPLVAAEALDQVLPEAGGRKVRKGDERCRRGNSVASATEGSDRGKGAMMLAGLALASMIVRRLAVMRGGMALGWRVSLVIAKDDGDLPGGSAWHVARRRE